MAEASVEIPKVHHDETDVSFALARMTQDGRGTDGGGVGDRGAGEGSAR